MRHLTSALGALAGAASGGVVSAFELLDDLCDLWDCCDAELLVLCFASGDVLLLFLCLACVSCMANGFARLGWGVLDLVLLLCLVRRLDLDLVLDFCLNVTGFDSSLPKWK